MTENARDSFLKSVSMNIATQIFAILFALAACRAYAEEPRSGETRALDHAGHGTYISRDAIEKSPIRTLEEVQLAFDRDKERFFALATEHNRRYPNSVGKIVLSITVEPDGTISECHLVSSTVSDPVLVEAILSETHDLNAGARPVPRATFPNYAIYVLAK